MFKCLLLACNFTGTHEVQPLLASEADTVYSFQHNHLRKFSSGDAILLHLGVGREKKKIINLTRPDTFLIQLHVLKMCLAHVQPKQLEQTHMGCFKLFENYIYSLYYILELCLIKCFYTTKDLQSKCNYIPRRVKNNLKVAKKDN